MSDPIQAFLDVAKENNVDKTLLKSSFVKNTLDKLETYGKDLGESVENWVKRPPLKPAYPTPNYEESTFVKPKKETTLYNVTNREDEVPFIKKASKFIKKVNFGIKGLEGKASYQNNSNEYTIIAGEKLGLEYTKEQGSTTNGIKGSYNVGNNKAALEYYSKNPVHSYSISIYNQDKNNGLTAKYANANGINSAFSIDQNSASLSCNYNKKYTQCNLSVGGYVTTGENYSNPLIGINGRITF